MPDTLMSALIQAPFVLVMAYLVQRFLASMAARDKEWQVVIEQIGESLDALTATIHKLSDLIDTHDALTRSDGRMRARRR